MQYYQLHLHSSHSSSGLPGVLQPPAQLLVLEGKCFHAATGLLEPALQEVPLFLLFFPPRRQTFEALLHRQVGLTESLWERIKINARVTNSLIPTITNFSLFFLSLTALSSVITALTFQVSVLLNEDVHLLQGFLQCAGLIGRARDVAVHHGASRRHDAERKDVLLCFVYYLYIKQSETLATNKSSREGWEQSQLQSCEKESTVTIHIALELMGGCLLTFLALVAWVA